MTTLKIKFNILLSTLIFSSAMCLCNLAIGQTITLPADRIAIKSSSNTPLLSWDTTDKHIVNISTEERWCGIRLHGNDGPLGKFVGAKAANGKVHMGIQNFKNEYVFYNLNNLWTKLIVGKNDIMLLKKDGRVAIGKGNLPNLMQLSDGTQISADDYRLFVEKGILTEKLKVAVNGQGDWADYVFDEDYEKMPIEDLEEFVTENKHLPKVPSAEEMVKNGLDVAKMDAKLLEKIEEAYLYIIDLNKKVDALATENESLKTSLESLSTSNK